MQPREKVSETLVREHQKNAVDIARELRESWDNGLDFPPTKLPERYLRGDLAVRIEGSAKADNIPLGKICLSVEHEPNAFHSSDGNIECGGGQDQFTMLVRCIHIVNDPQGIIERSSEHESGIASVRLHRLNDLSSSRADALYFSLISANCVFVHGLAQIDRELDSPGVLRPLLRARELPRDMIQARTQVMNDLATKNCESLWNDSVRMGFNRFLDGFRLIIGDNWVRPILKECGDFSFEIQDILVGPF